MKLVSKTESVNSIKKENEELISTNIRLRKYFKDITASLATLKSNYEPDKIKKLEEFQIFCEEINVKKSKLLKELNSIEGIIEKKKEIYYGLIAKQDQLDEKLHQLNEKETNLSLRESFVVGVEERLKELTR